MTGNGARPHDHGALVIVRPVLERLCEPFRPGGLIPLIGWFAGREIGISSGMRAPPRGWRTTGALDLRFLQLPKTHNTRLPTWAG